MFSDPIKNLKQFGLGDSMVVVDLGAGTGFYSIPAALMVPNGKVYAIEVQKDYMLTIKDKATQANINNLECLWGDIEKRGGTKLGDSIIDAIIASNILSQVENKNKFLEEIDRILKSKGRILLVDWSNNWLSIVSSGFKNIVPKETAKDLFESKGFVFEKEIDAGPHHYGMIFKKV